MSHLPRYDPVEVATHSDIADVRSEIASLRSEIMGVIAEHRSVTNSHGVLLPSLHRTLIAGLFTLGAAMAGVFFAVL